MPKATPFSCGVSFALNSNSSQPPKDTALSSSVHRQLSVRPRVGERQAGNDWIVLVV